MDIGRITNGVVTVASGTIDVPKRVFNDPGATSDALKLAQRINDLLRNLWPLTPVQPIFTAFSAVIDFISARNCFKRISDLVSGEAANTDRFSPRIPNWLRIASKSAFLVGDLTQTVKWFASIGFLDRWILDKTSGIEIFGKAIPVLKGVGDASCIAGASLAIADAGRLIVTELRHDHYMRRGRFNGSLAADHALEVAANVSKISGAVLSNIPVVPAIFTTVALTSTASLQLAKFFKKQYWDEKRVAEEGKVGRLRVEIRQLNEDVGLMPDGNRKNELQAKIVSLTRQAETLERKLG